MQKSNNAILRAFQYVFLFTLELVSLVAVLPALLVVGTVDVVRWCRFKRRLRRSGRIIGWNEAVSSLQEQAGFLLVELDFCQLPGLVWYVGGALCETEPSLPRYVTFKERVSEDHWLALFAKAEDWRQANSRQLEKARFVDIRWPRDINTLLASSDVPDSVVLAAPVRVADWTKRHT